MEFDEEVLFPNPKVNSDVSFDEGTEEIKNDGQILALKKKIREALGEREII